LTAFAAGLGLIAFFVIRAAIQRAEDRVIERYEAMRRAQNAPQAVPSGPGGGSAAPDPDLEGVSQEDFEAGCKDVLAQLAYRHREMRRPARRHGAP
jgi:hypothetical protein